MNEIGSRGIDENSMTVRALVMMILLSACVLAQSRSSFATGKVFHDMNGNQRHDAYQHEQEVACSDVFSFVEQDHISSMAIDIPNPRG